MAGFQVYNNWIFNKECQILDGVLLKIQIRLPTICCYNMQALDLLWSYGNKSNVLEMSGNQFRFYF